MRFRSQWLTRLSAFILVAAMRLLFRTLKLRFQEETPGTNPYDTSHLERYIYCVWHDSLAVPLFAGQHHSTAALTSKHADGSLVAEVLRLVGIKPIRGSTNRVAVGTLRDMVTAQRRDHLVITPDGPRGPARVMTPGMVYLSSRTGNPIVPTAYYCTRAWRFKGSWTHLVIPKPFSTVVLLAGPPVTVPPEIPSADFEKYVVQIQSEMDRLSGLAPAC